MNLRGFPLEILGLVKRLVGKVIGGMGEGKEENGKIDFVQGAVAQWLEQATHNRLVAGSNPAGPMARGGRGLGVGIFWGIFLGCLVGTGWGWEGGELEKIGRGVWKNECGGTREGLTSWNVGENFASMGIGHFIWYPAGVEGPFEESFPKLLIFLRARGAKPPGWVGEDCPWGNRGEFERALGGEKMRELRDFLAGTIGLQGQFLAERLREALPKMLASVRSGERERVRGQFERVMGAKGGAFALIDYVNFKGEGVKESERYGGRGWGLLQVLEGMKGSGGGAVEEFGRSAEKVLEERVKRAPAERGEGRWLAGWKGRVRAYGG